MMPITRTREFWKPLPPPGYPSLAQRVAAMQLAARSHSSLSSSSFSSSSFSSSPSSSTTTTPKAKAVVRHGYAIPLPGEDEKKFCHKDNKAQRSKKEEDTIPTTVTITTTTTTSTPEGLPRNDAGNSPLAYHKVQNDDDADDEEEEDNASLDHDHWDDDDDDDDDEGEEDDDNVSWAYDDLEDEENDSVVKLFKESHRARSLQLRNKDLDPRDDGNVTTTKSTTTSNVNPK